MRKGRASSSAGASPAPPGEPAAAPARPPSPCSNDGTARVCCGTQDVGTGTYTVFAQIVSDRTGIPVDKIRVVIGDSALPPGPTSGGSTATATVLPAIADATDNAVKVAIATAIAAARLALRRQDTPNARLPEGKSTSKTSPRPQALPTSSSSRWPTSTPPIGEGNSGALNSNPEARNYSTHSFGAQFVEVEWDPGIARLRVSRVVTVIDGGRIINQKDRHQPDPRRRRDGRRHGHASKRPSTTPATASPSTPTSPTTWSPPTPIHPPSMSTSSTIPTPSSANTAPAASAKSASQA